jgi:hypothetical protein
MMPEIDQVTVTITPCRVCGTRKNLRGLIRIYPDDPRNAGIFLCPACEPYYGEIFGRTDISFKELFELVTYYPNYPR